MNLASTTVIVILATLFDRLLLADGKGLTCNRTINSSQLKVSMPSDEIEALNSTDLYCIYNFEAPEEENLFWRLIFHRFSISSQSDDCKDGFIKIIDGYLSDESSAGKICGTFDRKHEYISESSKLKVIIYSKIESNHPSIDFVAKSESKWNLHQRFGQYPQLNPHRRGHRVSGTYCDRVYTEDECSSSWCHIQSPGFPGFYLPNMTCHYLIQVKNNFATLTLSSIDVDSLRCDSVECFPRILSWDEECEKEYVRVYDGATKEDPIIATTCGRSKSKQEIVASGPVMLIEFLTSEMGSLTNYGFEFRASGASGQKDEPILTRETCDETVDFRETSKAFFQSMKHWYPKNTTCNFRVLGLTHEVLEVNFYKFQAGTDDSFCSDYLMVYDGLQPDPSKVIIQLCDMNPPRSKILTNGPNVLIVFHSERGSLDGKALDFYLDVTSHDALRFGYSSPGSLCDESFIIVPDASGNFSSPRNFLKFQSIEKPVKCKYTFKASSAMYQRIFVEFQGMFDEQNKDCSSCYGLDVGHLRVYEGEERDGEMISCICGLSERGPKTFSFRSRGSKVSVLYNFTPRLIKQFPSHFGRAQVMFEGYYQSFHGPRCGKIIYPSTLDGFLEYPSSKIFQGLYFEKTRCIWEIKREKNKDFFIKVLDLFVQGTCQTDYLEIRSSKSPKDFSLRLCGNNTETVHQRVILRQEIVDASIEIEMLASTQGSTFNITWTQVDYHEVVKDPEALVQDDCAFQCFDRDSILCLDQSLICNGISNCPEIGDPSTSKHDEVGCTEVRTEWENWIAIGMGCTLAICVFVLIIIVYYRQCRNRKLAPMKPAYNHRGQCSTYTIS